MEDFISQDEFQLESKAMEEALLVADREGRRVDPPWIQRRAR